MKGPVLIMAGGTGGHVFPALAVAAELRRRGVEVVWLGTRSGLESRLVPAAGIAIHWLSVSGLRRSGLLRWLGAPLQLLRACAQAWRVLRRCRPASVLGMGGFVAGPGGLMAWLGGIPLVIHEQNSVPGLTNRLLARRARRVLAAFPDAFPRRLDVRVTGNPVRPEIAALPPPEQRRARRAGALRLLVFGGSQGARALNEVLPAALGRLDRANLEVWHQCGTGREADLAERYRRGGVQARVEPFIEDMAAAYAWADLVVARAGAMTVAELAAAGVGAVLVPYPFAVDDHQTANARHLERAGAAELIAEADLDAERLGACIERLWRSPGALLEMAARARRLARPRAAEAVAETCIEVAR